MEYIKPKSRSQMGHHLLGQDVLERTHTMKISKIKEFLKSTSSTISVNKHFTVKN